MGQSGNDLSWSIGPRASRPIRLLLTLTTSLMLGALVYTLGELVLFIVTNVTAPGPIDIGFVGFVVVFLVLIARWVVVLPQVYADAGEEQTSYLREEWHETVRWRRVGVGVTLVSVILGAVHLWLWGTDWLLASPRLLSMSAIGLGLTFATIAYLLSSAGRVDPERLELCYGDRHRIDLTSLVDARRFTLGDRTYLWVTFESGVRPSLPRVYLIPTSVVVRLWPLLQGQLEAAPTDDSSGQRTSRDTYLAVALLFAFALAFGLVAILAGAPLDVAIILASYFAIFAIVALLAEAFGT